MSNIKLPSQEGREDPIYKPPITPSSDPAKSAVFIFVHGLADSAAGLENVGDQFQQNSKLPYMSWIFPNGKFNHDELEQAWYTPNELSGITPSRPELIADEDESGMLETVAYLESLIDACVAAGVPLNRIVLGGFSQGCAMSLLLHVTSSKYHAQLGGIVGLLGYLPLCDEKKRLQELRTAAGMPAAGEGIKTPIFMARGQRDTLIPKRVWNYSLKVLKDLGTDESVLQAKEYPGLPHTLSGPVLRDMCDWLEKVIPEV